MSKRFGFIPADIFHPKELAIQIADLQLVAIGQDDLDIGREGVFE
jgi:hypothetical protein